MPLKIHCFQHVPFKDLGHIKTWINKEGHQLHYTRFFEKYTIPEPEDYDCLIVMGGPMGANDEEKCLRVQKMNSSMHHLSKKRMTS